MRINPASGPARDIALTLNSDWNPWSLLKYCIMGLRKNLPSILENGLASQSRQHVHLSATTDTARQVGTRHGKPVVLTIDAAAMYRDGHVFFLSANKVWLTHSVPLKYIAV